MRCDPEHATAVLEAPQVLNILMSSPAIPSKPHMPESGTRVVAARQPHAMQLQCYKHRLPPLCGDLGRTHHFRRSKFVWASDLSSCDMLRSLNSS